MAKEQYLDHQGLKTYDGEIKSHINSITNNKADSSDLTSHTSSKSNPHGVTAAQVGALPSSGGNLTGVIDASGTSNILDFGTSGWFRGKTTSGSRYDIFGYSTPTTLQVGGSYPALALKGKDTRPTYNNIDMALLSDVSSHTGNKSNPHGVTAAQVGAYTKAEIDTTITTLQGSIDSKANKGTTLADYGITDAETKGTASSTVSTHNVATTAHNDIRNLITGLTNRLNALADSDDTTLDQLSEIVAYIKANKTLIDSITTSKINISDIINNLTTNVTNKPLSAAQGVVIKGLIDALDNELDTKATITALNSHINTKTNPHGVTAAQVGLGNVNNTSDANKPVSTAQATAIADAKKAGTDAQTGLDSHMANKSNPHGVTLSQLGVTATATELNYVDGVTSSIQAQLDSKVKKAGDTMTGSLHIETSNPYVHFKDTGYSTNWYIQAYQDQFAFGPTFASAVKSDASGNMTVPGTVQGKFFKSDLSTSAIKPSDSNEVNFGSNANYIYFGYDNRVGSEGVVSTYNFGRSNGSTGATDGDIVCGSVSAGRTVKVGNAVTLQYNSTNECLDFIFT